jgi:hypothetical protein
MQFRITMATDCQALTRSMNVFIGHEQDRSLLFQYIVSIMRVLLLSHYKCDYRRGMDW